MPRSERYRLVLGHFQREAPGATTELEHGSDFQLLVAVVLSAQCTDRRVNMVTPGLFGAYPDSRAMAAAEPGDIYPYIRSVSYPNAKAGHLVGIARAIEGEFGSRVPDSMEDLVRLPGVGRKTANVMLAVAFGRPAIAVDTHVFRVSHRLGLVSRDATTPLKTERELLGNIPPELAAEAHHWLLLHGRRTCTSRAPHCGKCPFGDFCPKLMEGSRLGK